MNTTELTYEAAKERARLANEDLAKAAFAVCKETVRRLYPTARYVTLAVEVDEGYFLNGVKSITDTNEEYLLDNRSFTAEPSEEIEQLPWDDLFDPDAGAWEGEFALDLDNGVDE